MARLRLAGVDPVGDRADDEAARADRVVVAGDDVVGLVGIAVRVDERHDRQAEPARLAHRELLLAQVDDEHGVRLTAHVRDAAQVRVELVQLGLTSAIRSFGGSSSSWPSSLRRAQLVQPLDPVGDGAPVREQAAEPAVVHVRHADARRLLVDGVLALLLRADEQDRAAPLGDVAGEVVRLLDQLEGLLEVDDVDPAPLARR